MSGFRLEIMDKPIYGVRVVNANGDAELGNWHIADFACRQHAQFFIDAWNLQNRKQQGHYDSDGYCDNPARGY